VRAVQLRNINGLQLRQQLARETRPLGPAFRADIIQICVIAMLAQCRCLHGGQRQHLREIAFRDLVESHIGGTRTLGEIGGWLNDRAAGKARDKEDDNC
jgi:hypothetical protein